MSLLSPVRYESPIAPSVEVFQESAVEAFPVAIVGFAVAFSVAKVYSIKHDYPIDGNQVRSMSILTCSWLSCWFNWLLMLRSESTKLSGVQFTSFCIF